MGGECQFPVSTLLETRHIMISSRKVFEAVVKSQTTRHFTRRAPEPSVKAQLIDPTAGGTKTNPKKTIAQTQKIPEYYVQDLSKWVMQKSFI